MSGFEPHRLSARGCHKPLRHRTGRNSFRMPVGTTTRFMLDPLIAQSIRPLNGRIFRAMYDIRTCNKHDYLLHTHTKTLPHHSRVMKCTFVLLSHFRLLFALRRITNNSTQRIKWSSYAHTLIPIYIKLLGRESHRWHVTERVQQLATGPRIIEANADRTLGNRAVGQHQRCCHYGGWRYNGGGRQTAIIEMVAAAAAVVVVVGIVVLHEGHYMVSMM